MNIKYYLAIWILSVFIISCKQQPIVLSQAPGETPFNYNTISISGNALEYLDSYKDIYVIPERQNSFSCNINVKNADIKDIKILDYTTSVDIMNKYLSFTKLHNIVALPQQYYTINIKDSNLSGVTYNININPTKDLAYGQYFIPICVNLNGTSNNKFFFYEYMPEITPLSAENPKPMPPGNHPLVKKPMKMIAYVETNDVDARNMASFVLKDTKQPIFDYVVLFAANMNYDKVTKKRYLFFNDKLKPYIDNPELMIRPFQRLGIKVIIDILPNHQGVGYENFQSYEDAKAFVQQMKDISEKVGIDGWDIDEEYAEYGNASELPIKGTTSVLWFMRACKELMPNKILSLYEYNISVLYNHTPDSFSKKASDYIDYAVSDYGVSSDYLNLPADKFCPYSVQASYGQMYWAERNASKILDRGNAGLMFFNITPYQMKNGSAVQYISKVTQLFYGQDCIFTGPYYKGPKDLGQ